MKVVELVLPAIFWVRRFMVAVVCVLAVACGGGGGPEAIANMFSTMPAAVTLAVGETPAYTIGGGTAPYTANSSNLNFASVTVSGKTLTIFGKAAGAATVTVFDATGKSLGTVATIGSSAAAAPLFVASPEAVTVSLSTAASYAISGGVGPYTASSSNAAVALASVNGTSLSIAGLLTGVAQVSVFDALGETKIVNVTVGSGNAAIALFITVPGTATIGVADKPVYTIGGGTPPYTASSTNAGLVKATVSGTTLTLEGVAAGTAQIQIFDSTGTARSATVTVGSGSAAVALFMTAPSTVTVAPAAVATYAIGGGTGPYTVSTSNAASATVAVAGSTLSITGGVAGTAQVTVFDAAGASVNTLVTVSTGNTPNALFVTAPSAVSLALGTPQTYTIGGGTAPYLVSTSSAGVVTAAVSTGTTLTLTGVTAGTAQVVIFDATGNSVTLSVTANTTALFMTAPSAVTVAPGTTAGYTISGGTAPYTVSSSNGAAASAAITGTNLSITGVGAGTAQITVFDARGVQVSTVVTVSAGTSTALFMTAPSTVTVAPAAVATYAIGGGTGPYTVSTSNAASATVAVAGSTLSITGGVAGTAQVTVFDAAGASVNTLVTVSTGPAATLYITAPVAVTVSLGGTGDYFIGGGVAPYRVSSANASVATAAVVSGTTVSITGVALGSAQVTVFDSAGSAVSTTVTISTGAPTTALYVTAPSAVTLAPAAAPTYTIGGGSAPYFVSSNNNGVATVGVAGTTLTITGVANGVAQINVLDSTGAAVRITVNVGSGGTGLYMTAPGAISMAPSTALPFAIGGGTAPYSVSTGNAAIATASVTGTVLTINGVAAGTAQVVVFDATGSSVSTTVTIGSSTSAALYVTAPDGVTMTLGTTEMYTLGGGTSPYVPVSSNGGVAVASLVGGNQVRIAAASAGTALVAIFDANGNSTSVAVTVVGASSAALFITAPAAVTISTGGTRDYTVGGGSGTYSAPVSSNQAVASASLVGSTLTVSGVTGGSASITVRDSLNATVTFNVTVGSGAALFTSAPAAVTLAIGATPSYTIGGGAPITGVGTLPYVTSSSNAGVVTSVVSMVGTTPTLTLTGVAAGSAVVNVLDSTGSLAAISVTVGSGGGGGAALFTTAPGTITIANGAAPVYSVSGGTGPYTATSSNPAVATTPTGALLGGVLTITSTGPGSTNVLIVDAVGASVTIAVTVTPAATTPLVVTPSTVTANVGDVLSFTISGASPAYSIAVNNTSVATSSTAAVAASGGAFTITLRNVGTTTVAITDSLGQTTTLALTVNATATTLRLSPSAITVGEDLSALTSVVLNIYGGTAPYSAFTDDLVLSGVSIAGNVLTVGVGTKGNRCISSFDNTDPLAPVYTPYGTVPVTLTVVDFLGASATSVMTIRDNGVSGTFPGGC